jgi:CPA2 family monovalent cation:H+ antiporter-2
MAGPALNLDAYSDALVVLGTAGIVVPLVRRWRVSPVLGYLAAGVILGPLGLGSFKSQLPFLHWVTVVDAKNGPRSPNRRGLPDVPDRHGAASYGGYPCGVVFGLGSLQVVLSAIVIGAIAAWFGNGPEASIIIGLCLALSSTAIVIEVLSHQRRLTTAAGRTSFSILLFQDLGVVPILLLVSMGASRAVARHGRGSGAAAGPPLPWR